MDFHFSDICSRCPRMRNTAESWVDGSGEIFDSMCRLYRHGDLSSKCERDRKRAEYIIGETRKARERGGSFGMCRTPSGWGPFSGTVSHLFYSDRKEFLRRLGSFVPDGVEESCPYATEMKILILCRGEG